MDLAKRLIREAKLGQGDLAKFQLYDHTKLYGNNPNIPNVELTFEQAKMLFEYGKECGIEVFFSVFDTERVRWCEEIGVNRYKLASTRLTKELFYAVVDTNKPIIQSLPFGRCEPDVLSWLHRPYKCVYLYCIPCYPTPLSDLHFEGIRWGKNDMYQGYSDHTIGLWAAKVALARGAEIIEKHFSLSYNIGIDGKWSMTPEDLKELKRWESVCRQCL